MLAYDDVASVQYFGQPLKGYWTKNGDDIAALLQKSAAEYESIKERSQKFDAELMADLEKAGGPKYAWLGAFRLSAVAGREQSHRRFQWSTALFLQRKHQQRLHGHRRRFLSAGAITAID